MHLFTVQNELSAKAKEAAELGQRLVGKTREVEDERRKRRAVEEAYAKVCDIYIYMIV